MGDQAKAYALSKKGNGQAHRKVRGARGMPKPLERNQKFNSNSGMCKKRPSHVKPRKKRAERKRKMRKNYVSGNNGISWAAGCKAVIRKTH